MELFSNYITPLVNWIHDHPHLALFVTFLISFSESLAVVGSIIPGSISMTAIGILAGSGIISIELTLYAAILGAIAGDGASYSLGYHFRDKLTSMWPFSTHPKWLDTGHLFFKKYGSKSVLIGRFAGPLRSIVPVVAGMMGMNRWQFFIANFLSAIGWSLLYVIPGVIIGAASHELSNEDASKLFFTILGILVIGWLLSLLVKWIIVYLHQRTKNYLDSIWKRLLQYKSLKRFIRYLTPENERSHAATAYYVFTLIFIVILCALLLLFINYISISSYIDYPVFTFTQSIRNEIFDILFIGIQILITAIPQIIFMISIGILALLQKNIRFFLCWTSLVVFSLMVAIEINFYISPLANYFSSYYIISPISAFLLACSSCIFLILVLKNSPASLFNTLLIILLSLGILSTGLSIIYLGQYGLVEVITISLIGYAISLLHWIVLRRKAQTESAYHFMVLVALGVFFIGLLLSTLLYFQKIVSKNEPQTKQYVITENAWWNQKSFMLPVYTKNRFGKPVAIFNVQYVGPLKEFESQLLAAGWKIQKDSYFYALLQRITHSETSPKLPFVAQLYLNHKAKLLMTNVGDSTHPPLTLRLWASNFHLQNQQIIWIGSVQPNRNISLMDEARLSPEFYLDKALPHFVWKSNYISTRKNDITKAYLLLIKLKN